MGKIGKKEKEVLVSIATIPSELRPTNTVLAETLGVTEGTVRYHLKRIVSGAQDGRTERYSRVSEWSEQISTWVSSQKGSEFRYSSQQLYDMLKEHHGFDMSVDALRRYMNKRYPELMAKPKRIRLETPPGYLSQIDWKEDVTVEFGGAGKFIVINLFVMVLAFSRASAVIVRKRRDLQSLLSALNEAWTYLGGVTRYLRPDGMKTAVNTYHGKAGIELNQGFERHLKKVNCTALPSRPRTPRDKGKVEKRIRDVITAVHSMLSSRIWYDLGEIQAAITAVVEEKNTQWRSGATGLTVQDSLAYERHHLQSLPESLPQAPVKEQTKSVSYDGTVYFMKNYYQVPEEYCGRNVLCTFTGHEIIIVCDGKEVVKKPWLPEAEGMVVLSEEALKTTEKRFNNNVENMALEVASRQIDYYQDIVEMRHDA